MKPTHKEVYVSNLYGISHNSQIIQMLTGCSIDKQNVIRIFQLYIMENFRHTEKLKDHLYVHHYVNIMFVIFALSVIYFSYKAFEKR